MTEVVKKLQSIYEKLGYAYDESKEKVFGGEKPCVYVNKYMPDGFKLLITGNAMTVFAANILIGEMSNDFYNSFTKKDRTIFNNPFISTVAVEEFIKAGIDNVDSLDAVYTALKDEKVIKDVEKAAAYKKEFETKQANLETKAKEKAVKEKAIKM